MASKTASVLEFDYLCKYWTGLELNCRRPPMEGEIYVFFTLVVMVGQLHVLVLDGHCTLFCKLDDC
jgi:hypothetical protein